MARRSLVPRFAFLALVAALGVSSTGCGKVREISDCRGLAQEVNLALDEIEALAKKPSPDREAQLAKRYGELAKRLEPRSQGTTPLALTLREYVAVLRATETALKNHVEGAKAPGTRPTDIKRELDRLGKREKAAVTRIDVECHS
jgi:hypothetical protein